MKPLVSIVIVSYNSKRFIKKCLLSVFAQKYTNWELIFVINGSNDGSKEIIEEMTSRRKRVTILDPGANLQFAAGNNYGMKKASGQYILALNQDTVLEPDFLSIMVTQMEADQSLGSASGKLLHYRYDINSKTKILDSTGIEIYKSRKIIDRGQWEEDRGQYDNDCEIFGVSGAAAFYRASALEDVKVTKQNGECEYFDESFVAYQEDVDLSWRLQLLGYRCRYFPEAVLHHGRTVGRSWPSQIIRFILNRKRQPKQVRRQAFRNHHLVLLKNELPTMFWRHFFYIFIREFLIICYVTVFEIFQYKSFLEVFKGSEEALRKRREIMSKKRVESKDIIHLFN